MPSVFAGVSRNAADTGGAHGGNHHKDIFAHVREYITPWMKYASWLVKYAIEVFAAV
jgi:hypothetical protein